MRETKLKLSQFLVYALPFLLAFAVGPVTAVSTIGVLLLFAVLLPPSLPELLTNRLVRQPIPEPARTGKGAFLHSA